MTARAPHQPPLWLSMLGLAAVAANLRTAVASLPPLVESVGADLGLGSAALGALTTLPVLCMGLFAPAAQRLAHRIGAAGAVEVAVGCVAVGTLLRLWGGAVWPLYAGTLVAGIGVAVGGTLLPGLVKELFPPRRAGLVTGLYMVAMMTGATAASALAVPLEQGLASWEASLASWSALAVLGAVGWHPLARAARRRRAAAGPAVTVSHGLPWRRGTAWLVAGYLALQSWSFYCSLAWLSPSYAVRGWEPAEAGYLLSVFMVTQLVGGLVGPVLSDRVSEHRLLLVPAAALCLVGQAGLWLAPDAAPWVWAAVVGAGQGAAFSLGLVLLVDYGATPAASARLAGMAFFVSYTLASVGPTATGALRDATGGFRAVWLLLTVVTAVQVAVSWALRPDLRPVT